MNAKFPELVGEIEAHTGIALDKNGVRSLQLPSEKSDVADAKAIYGLTGTDGEHKAILILSPAAFPNRMERVTKNIDTVCAGMDSKLLAPIVRHIHFGWHDGISYAVFPFVPPISSNRIWRKYQITRLRGPVSSWLADIARSGMRAQSDIEEKFIRPVSVVLADTGFSKTVRDGAEESLAALKAGHGSPRLTLQHGDFWIGNVHLDSSSQGRGFRVIDWGTAMLDGYPLVDLIRFGLTITRRHDWLYKSMKRYMDDLGLDRKEALYHVYAAVGWQGLHLENFPRELYLETSERMFAALRVALSTDP